MVSQNISHTGQLRAATLRMPQQAAPVDRAAPPPGVQDDTCGVAASSFFSSEALHALMSPEGQRSLMLLFGG